MSSKGLLRRLAEAADVVLGKSDAVRTPTDAEAMRKEQDAAKEEQSQEQDLQRVIGSIKLSDSGQEYWGGIYSEEYHEDLATLQSRAERLNELRVGDPIVAGMLAGVERSLVQAHVSIVEGPEPPPLPSEMAAKAEEQAKAKGEAPGATASDVQPPPSSSKDAGKPAPTVEPAAPGKTAKTANTANTDASYPSKLSEDDAADEPIGEPEPAEAEDPAELAKADASAKLVRLLTANLLGDGEPSYRMLTPWRQLLHEMLTAQAFGFALFERQLAVKTGSLGDAVLVHGMHWMHPRSVRYWHVADDGALLGVTQVVQSSYYERKSDGRRVEGDALRDEMLKRQNWQDTLTLKNEFRTVFIERNRLAIFVRNKEGTNYEGRADIRPVYGDAKHAAFLRKVQRVAAVKRGIPIPKATITKEASPESTAKAIEFAKRMTQSAQERSFVVEGPGTTMGYVDQAGGFPTFDEQIRAAQFRTAFNFGTEFRLLGSEGSGGSYSAGSVQARYYDLAIDEVAGWIEEGINTEIIEPLVMLNAGIGAVAPRIRFAGTTPRSYAEILTAKQQGAVTWTERDEQDFRAQYDMPPLTAEELAERQQKRDMAAAALMGMSGSDQKPGDKAGKAETPDTKAPPPPQVPPSVTSHALAESPGPFKSWRPLRDHEAQHMRLAEMDAKLEAMCRDGLLALKNARERIVRHAVKHATIKGHSVTLPRLPSADLRKALKDIAERSRLYGRQTAEDEIRSQLDVSLAEGNTPPPAFDVNAIVAARKRGIVGKTAVQADLEDQLATVIELNIDAILTSVGDAVKREMLKELEKGSSDDDAREAGLRETLSRSDAPLNKTANELTSKAFNGGRSETTEAAIEAGVPVEQVTRTAVLDDATCDECTSLDGTTVNIDSEDYMKYMPPSFCSGGGYCRCAYELTVGGKGQ